MTSLTLSNKALPYIQCADPLWPQVAVDFKHFGSVQKKKKSNYTLWEYAATLEAYLNIFPFYY